MQEELLDDFQASDFSDELMHASFRKRLFATAIDVFILMGIYMVFSGLMGDIIQPFYRYDDYYYYLELLSFIAITLYATLSESGSRQGTLGKQFLKLKVVDKQGNRIGFKHALGRFYVKLVLSPILLVVLLFKIKNERNEGILGAYVIEKKLK